MPLVAQLRAAARPFVARSLRGARFKRSLALSALLALVTCVLGGWLALGSGDVEREARQTLRFERNDWQEVEAEFVYIVRHEWDYDRAVTERAQLLGGTAVSLNEFGGGVSNMAARGLETLRAALSVPSIPVEHAELAIEARAVLERHAHWSSPAVGRTHGFNWQRREDVERLAAIVEHDLVPPVATYRSPLDERGAIRFIGLLAGLLLTALAIVVTPVLVGIAIAQEAHENTLQPLSGTSLSPRQIAIGMLLGPAAPVLLVAVPQIAIVAFAAMFCAAPLLLFAFFAILVPCTWVLATLAQGVGLHAGKRRGPGIVGMTLLALASTWTLVGTMLAFDTGFSKVKAAVMTVLPSGALAHFLRSAFAGPVPLDQPHDPLAAGWFAGRLVATAVACVVVGVLALHASERRIFGRYGAPLGRLEAMLGVAVLSTLTLLAMPDLPTEAWLGTLAMMVMPMQILVMGRVPVGDAPEGTPRVPLGALLGEFAAFVGIHAALASVLVGPGFLADLDAMSVFQLGWALAVAALVSIRVVALPARLPALVGSGCAYLLAIVSFGTGVVTLVQNTIGGRGEPVLFVLWDASPVLGCIQAVLTLAIPVLFVRALRRPATQSAPAKDSV